MTKRFPIYPFLFVLYFVLTPLVLNLEQIDPLQVARPLIVLLTIVLLSIFVFYAFFKDWQYAGYFVFLCFVFFFAYGHLSRLAQTWIPGDQELVPYILMLIWGIFLVVLSLKVFWRRLGCAGWIHMLLTVILVTAILILGISGVGEVIQTRQSFARTPGSTESPAAADPIHLNCEQQPDIYYIVLDGYGRADILEGRYGVDNAAFLRGMERKGFFIGDQSHTNYTQTIYSIPSALSFTYLQPEQIGVSGAKYFMQLMVENRIMRLLKACGYKTVSIESGFYYTNHFDTDVRLSSGTILSEFERLLLADTPWDVLMDALDLTPAGDSHPGHRVRVLDSFKYLSNLPRMAGPKFVFAHIVTPHPPYVFGPQGEAMDPGWSYSMADGSNYSGDWAGYRQGYAAQVQFINQKVEQTVDAILAKSDQPPVIIIQGDHGPGGSLDWGSPERTCLWERSGILNAYYLPGSGKDALYSEISPVNSFRVVLNTYFGADLPLLPDETYFTSHELPRQIIDITDERESKENCFAPR